MALVFWAISSAAASRIVVRVAGGSLPTSPSRWAVSRSICPTWASSAVSSVLGGGQVLEAERARAGARCRHRTAPARPPSRTGRAGVGRSPRRGAGRSSNSCAAGPPATPPRIRPIPAMIPPTTAGMIPSVAILSTLAATETIEIRRPTMTITTEMRETERQVVGSGATSNLTLTSPASAARSSRARTSSARRRSTPARRTGSGLADGWVRRQLVELGGHLDRLAVALVALLGRVAIGDEALRLARLLEHAPALGEDLSRSRPAGRGRRRAGRGPPPAARGPPRPARPMSGPCRPPAPPP